MDTSQPIIHCKEYEDLDEEKAARSIVVSNIPPDVGGEKLFIHFQKNKNGGGEIDRLCMIESDSTAVITFEEVEVARRALAREQIYQNSGTRLTVQAFGVVRPPDVLEVFQRVSARLNWEIFRSSGPVDSGKLLRRLATETEVEWHEACDGFIVSGNFEQLQNAYEQLNRSIHRIASQNPELRRVLSSDKGGGVASSTVGKNGQDSLDNDENERGNKEIIEENHPFDVEPRFMTFLKERYSEMLHEIEEEFSVRIEWPLNGEDTKASIKALPDCNFKEKYDESHEKFCESYKRLFSRMKQEIITHSKSDPKVKAVVNSVNGAYKVIIFEEAGKVLVYGEAEHVDSAVKAIKVKLSGVEHQKENTRRRKTKNAAFADEGNGQRKQEAWLQNLDQVSRLQQVLANGVRLSVYQGDITNQHVDVIVNAANGWLNHDGGVAKAIQDKGGHQILRESRAIIFSRSNTPLSAGEVVITSGGNLPCSAVIHTVGPVWGQQQSILLLHRAVIWSLRLAASHNFRSIALPAISSGTCGMPKELCARAMFDGVQEYSQSVEARQFQLCDVSFVNIDQPTVKVFKQEFVKRFNEGTKVTSTNESQMPAVGGSIAYKSLPFQDQEMFYSMPTSISMPPTVNQHHHQVQDIEFQPSTAAHIQAPRVPFNQSGNTFQGHDLSLQSAQMSAGPRMPFSPSENTVKSHDLLFQNEQKSPGPPSYPTDASNGKTTSTEHERRMENPFDGSKESSPNVEEGKATSESISNTAFNRGSANQSSANFTGHVNGSGNVKSRGRGRGALAANVFGNFLPGTAVKVSSEANGTNGKPSNQNVQNKDLEPQSTIILATKVESKHTPGPPPGAFTDYSPKITNTTDSQSASHSVGEEKLPDLTTVKPETSKTKQAGLFLENSENNLNEDENAGERNDPDLTQTSGEKPTLKQKDDRFSRDGNNDFNRQGDAISATPTGVFQNIQVDCVTSDLPEPSVEKLPMKTETNPAAQKKDVITSANATKNQTKSLSLNKPSESSAQVTTSSFDRMTTADQEHGVSTDEGSWLAAEKQQLNGGAVVEAKELELPGNGQETTMPKHVKKDWEQRKISPNVGESDNSNDSALQHNTAVSQKQDESEQDVSNRNAKPEDECDDANLLREKNGQQGKDNIDGKIGETIQKFAENATNKDTPSAPEREGKKDKESNIDTEDEQMPPLSDLSEEDNNATSPTQDPHKTDSSGDQPIGYMKWLKDVRHLPGYMKYGTIVIQYSFPQGIQSQEHPTPGKPYLGYEYEAYLPDSPEGREVLELLRVAFDNRQLFTLKDSNVSSEPAQIAWGDIPHKTNRTGGSLENGYPDPSYLEEVKKKLLEHGIVPPSK